MSSNRFTNSNDPQMVKSRLFIGNLDCEKVTSGELETMFSKYGKILGASLHKNFAFVQFENESCAKKAVSETNHTVINGKKIDVNIASERRRQQANREGSWNKSDSSSHSRMRGPSRFSESSLGFDRQGGRPGPYFDQGGPMPPPSQYVGYPSMLPQDRHSAPPNHKPHPDMWMNYPNPQPGYLDNHPLGPLMHPHAHQHHDMMPGPQGPSSQNAGKSLIDCEIVSASSKFSNYTDYIHGQIVSRGLKCNVNYPSTEALVPVIKTRAMTTGVPFCVVIENGTDLQPFISVCLYYGHPKEHRNMTIDAALELLHSNITSYGFPPKPQSSVIASTASMSSIPQPPQTTFPAAAAQQSQMKFNAQGLENRPQAALPYSSGNLR